MKKLTFTSQTLKSNNIFAMYNVKCTSSIKWMEARRWLNRWATEDFVISELTRSEWDRDEGKRYGCRIVGFKSMKDALAFSLKFDRYEEVKVWDSNETFTYVQFVE